MNNLYAIALTFIKGIGPISAKNLLAHFGGFDAVFAENKAALAKIPRIGQILSDEKIKKEALLRAEQELNFAEKHRIKVHFYTDKTYPYRLKECEDSPIILYSIGNEDFNSGHFLAVVGTRNITPYGKEVCSKIINELSVNQSNTTIVSGLAYGVDGCAHKAALTEKLKTFAVVAHGLDTIYPSQHKALAEKIVKSGGAIVTEYPSKTAPEAANFVQRNRIIAGLCDATLVVESAEKGGALLTALAANSYNRDVFAIAGRVGDEFSAGCNNLIKTNCAQLATSAADIEQFMDWEKSEAKQQTLFAELSDEEQKIVENLHAKEMNANDLSRELNMPVQKLLSTLILMEFKGLITALPGNYYKIKL
ncbi:MAG: DNA-processing protein DprA [Prevotellaceae bacterium]|nr:DNA-processing protein DprA [Prevotellaceae bacterium]